MAALRPKYVSNTPGSCIEAASTARCPPADCLGHADDPDSVPCILDAYAACSTPLDEAVAGLLRCTDQQAFVSAVMACLPGVGVDAVSCLAPRTQHAARQRRRTSSSARGAHARCAHACRAAAACCVLCTRRRHS